MTLGSKFVFRSAKAAADVQHDQTLEHRAGFESDLPDIVFPKDAGLHAGFQGLRREPGGGRAAGAKVAGKLASACAAAQEHQFEEARLLKSKIEEDVEIRGEPALGLDGAVGGLEPLGKLLETRVGKGIEEAIAVGEVPVESHRGDADGFGHVAHGDGLGAGAGQQPAGGRFNPIGGRGFRHVYGVYHRKVYAVYLTAVP